MIDEHLDIVPPVRKGAIERAGADLFNEGQRLAVGIENGSISAERHPAGWRFAKFQFLHLNFARLNFGHVHSSAVFFGLSRKPFARWIRVKWIDAPQVMCDSTGAGKLRIICVAVLCRLQVHSVPCCPSVCPNDLVVADLTFCHQPRLA